MTLTDYSPLFIMFILLVLYTYLVYLKLTGKRPPDRTYYEARKLYKKAKNARLKKFYNIK